MALRNSNVRDCGNSDVSVSPSPKKQKVNDINSRLDSIHSKLTDLSQFDFERILSDNSERKTICLQGKFKNTLGDAVVILEKKPFDEDNVRGILLNPCPTTQQFSNDVYGNYLCKAPIEYNEIKATVIHPATAKHISKYESQPVHLIEETPAFYKSITLPFLQKEQFNIQWVINILEHKSESDRIVFEDPDPETGFVLLPDLKWDGQQIENLYLIAIINKLGILSLRDLKNSHLPLLKNVLKKGVEAIEEKYSVPKTRLRVYLHYQPSFYHLHIHFTSLQYDAPGIRTEKSHLLQTVINNLELNPDYYEKTTLLFTVKETDNLFKAYEEKGLVKKTTC